MLETVMYLRRAIAPDEGSIHELFRIPKVFEYLADGQEPPPSIASEWIHSAAADVAQYGGGLWVLVNRTDQTVSGVVRLAGDDTGALELIYLLHPTLWRQGLATRMAHTVMAQAFATGLASTIWAGADVSNTASIAVIQRLGMQFWRTVQYPLGAGMEYQIQAVEFNPARIEPLPIN